MVQRDQPEVTDDLCTHCHGSAARSGEALDKAAPPIDLSGNTDVTRPGVGAHERHLTATSRHEAIACTECHVVPESTYVTGHIDTGAPAEFTPGDLAQTDDHKPTYDATTHKCSDTYCHMDATPEWTNQTEDACGTCHGLPPQTDGHPQVDTCYRCHEGVTDEDGKIVSAAKHINGKVDRTSSCNGCHGGEDGNAPPTDVQGNTEVSNIGVGAHQLHVQGTDRSAKVACDACHTVPGSPGAEGHMDSTPGAEVTFSGVAITGQRTPEWDRDKETCSATWCHGPTSALSSLSPQWTSSSATLACDGCHTFPPGDGHLNYDKCSVCHPMVVGTDNSTIINADLHVDGTVQADVPDTCNDCHGTDSTGAPPPALNGSTDPSTPGVGAHAAHLDSSTLYRTVLCEDCHVVPGQVTASSHIDDTAGAELTFSGIALTANTTPLYTGGKCTDSYCHGAVTSAGNPTGGTNIEPTWTAGSGEVFCGSCHGMPPPLPHQDTGATKCSTCHPNVTDQQTFVDPQKHGDGKLD